MFGKYSAIFDNCVQEVIDEVSDLVVDAFGDALDSASSGQPADPSSC